MKQIIYAILGMFLLASCQQEESLSPAEDCGYLSIAELSLQTINENVVYSRADDVTLTVELWKDNALQRTLTDAELQGRIELEAGTGYAVRAYSSAYGTDSSWGTNDKGEPIYFKEVPFSVEAGKTTQVTVEVPMITFGVYLDFPFESDFVYVFSVRVGERSVVLKHGETAYFTPDEGSTFSYSISLTNDDGEEHGLPQGTYPESGSVVTGTVYKVSYQMETQTLNVNP